MHRKSAQQTILIFMLIAVAVMGCSQPTPTSITEQATEEPSPSATVKLSPGEKLATSRVESAVTANAQLTARALTPTTTPRPPTITPTPSLTPTSTPSVPLSVEGPWLLFRASIDPSVGGSLWAMNQDGTGLTELLHETMAYYSPQPVSSLKDGLLIAYVTGSDDDPKNLQLKIFHWPSGEVEMITSLFHATESNPFQYVQIAWTRDGTRFAFLGQIDGPTMDVYLYDLAAKSITRLSSGEGQAYNLSWSPDERWVIHEAFSFVGMGGPESDGMWAAWPDGSGSATIFDRSKTPGDFGQVSLYRWQDDTHVVLINRPYDQEVSLVQMVDVNTGQIETIFKEIFQNVAYSPEHDSWLLTPGYVSASPNAIIPLRMYKDSQTIDIPDHPLDYVWWQSELDEFLGYSEERELYSVSVSGDVAKIPIFEPHQMLWPLDLYISPDRKWWAWFDYAPWEPASELWVGPPMHAPMLIAPPETADQEWPSYMNDIFWSPDSQRLFMSTNSGLFVGQPPDFTPAPVVASTNERRSDVGFFIWVP